VLIRREKRPVTGREVCRWGKKKKGRVSAKERRGKKRRLGTLKKGEEEAVQPHIVKETVKQGCLRRGLGEEKMRTESKNLIIGVPSGKSKKGLKPTSRKGKILVQR